MGTITGTTLINKVATILYDANNVKWSRSELLNWLNDAQRAITILMPEAISTKVIVPLTAGARQSLPSDCWLLLEITSNMGTTGTTRGRALRKTMRETLDETNPTWYDDAPAPSITLFMYDSRDRTTYEVYPPADGTSYLEVIYAPYPVDLSTEAATLQLADVYEPALIDYMLFRCKSKGSDFADPVQAAKYYDNFTAYVSGGAGMQNSVGRSPE